MRSRLGHGDGGKNTLNQLELKKTITTPTSPERKKHILIGAFAMAMREARFLKPTHKRLAACTVRDTVQYVCATF